MALLSSNVPRLSSFRLYRLERPDDGQPGRWVFADLVAARSRREAVKTFKATGRILPAGDDSRFGRQPWQVAKV